jgi:hypothetical protein
LFTKKFADHTETNPVAFADIAKIEHIFGGLHATFEVVAIATDGTRYTIKESNDSTLIGYAERMAGIMKKPLEDIRKLQGFDPTTTTTTIDPKSDANTQQQSVGSRARTGAGALANDLAIDLGTTNARRRARSRRRVEEPSVVAVRRNAAAPGRRRGSEAFDMDRRTPSTSTRPADPGKASSATSISPRC